MAYDEYDRYWTIDLDGNRVYKEIHRDVMEKKLGRKLLSTEVVHHIDGNKKNNNSDNLIVFRSPSDHNRYHITGVLIEMEDGTYTSPPIYNTFICKNCGITFKSKKKDCVFCSMSCQIDYITIHDIPTREEMIKIIKNGSLNKVSKEYNVSYDTVKSWAKKYNIPVKRIKKIKKEKEKNNVYINYNKIPITIVNKKNPNEQLKFKNIYDLTEYFKNNYDSCTDDYCIRKNIIRVLTGERKSFHGFIIKARNYKREKNIAMKHKEMNEIEKELKS